MEGPKVARAVYDRLCLLSLRSSAHVPLPAAAAARVRQLGLRRHRGCQAGRRSRFPVPRLRPTGNGTYVVTGNRPTPSRRRSVSGSDRPNVVPIRPLRHTETTSRAIVFGSMNVASLSPSRLDELFVVARHQALDVLLLCETWHDAESISIRRIRADGFTVVERARPRRRNEVASLSVNHGGVAIVAAAGIRLTSVNIGVQPSTFEFVAARVTSGISSCIVLVVYRPGSAAITATFF